MNVTPVPLIFLDLLQCYFLLSLFSFDDGDFSSSRCSTHKTQHGKHPVHAPRSAEECKATIMQEMHTAFLLVIQAGEKPGERGKTKMVEKLTDVQMEEACLSLYHGAKLSPDECSKLEISKEHFEQRKMETF